MTRIQPALDLALAQDWDTLLKLMAHWATSRATAPTLTDLTYLSLVNIADLVASQVSDGPANVAFRQAAQSAYQARPTNHLMAALLAMIHIRLGWYWHGG